jgi:thioredoxin 1
MTLTITDENFEATVLKSSQLVMLDFWATWCGPCNTIAPIIEELSAEYEGKLTVGKVNIDDCTRVIKKYSVRSIPTILFFKNGEQIDKMVGAASKKVFEDKIKSLL